MWKTKQPYRDLGEDYFDRVDKHRAARAMLKRLDRLGYQVQVLEEKEKLSKSPTDHKTEKKIREIEIGIKAIEKVEAGERTMYGL